MNVSGHELKAVLNRMIRSTDLRRSIPQWSIRGTNLCEFQSDHTPYDAVHSAHIKGEGKGFTVYSCLVGANCWLLRPTPCGLGILWCRPEIFVNRTVPWWDYRVVRAQARHLILPQRSAFSKMHRIFAYLGIGINHRLLNWVGHFSCPFPNPPTCAFQTPNWQYFLPLYFKIELFSPVISRIYFSSTSMKWEGGFELILICTKENRVH